MFSIYYFSVTCTDLHNYESRVVLLRKGLTKNNALEYLEICNEVSECYSYNTCKARTFQVGTGKKDSIYHAHYFITDKLFSTFNYFKVKDDTNLGPLPKDFIKNTFPNSYIREKEDDPEIESFISIDKEYGFTLVEDEVLENKYKHYIDIIQKVEDIILKNALVKQFNADVFWSY